MIIKKNRVLARSQAKASSERWQTCRESYQGDLQQCRQAGVVRALEGIPIVVKDEINVSGYTTSYGLDTFRVDKEFVIHSEDSQSEVVKRMIDEGAIVLGKSNHRTYVK